MEVMVSPFKVVLNISMLLWLIWDVDSNMLPFLTNIALSYFLWGRSTARVIPGTHGRL